jgi:GrpB-like predicted nucleotidyltransferase (UPF0157 family)
MILSCRIAAMPTIFPYTIRPAICRDHDPRAAEVARQIAALITSQLPHVIVEDVGSTSVPGCAGKGTVDLMIPIADADLDSVKQVLDRLGFQRQTNRDPFPEDRPMRVTTLARGDRIRPDDVVGVTGVMGVVGLQRHRTVG